MVMPMAETPLKESLVPLEQNTNAGKCNIIKTLEIM